MGKEKVKDLERQRQSRGGLLLSNTYRVDYLVISLNPHGPILQIAKSRNMESGSTLTHSTISSMRSGIHPLTAHPLCLGKSGHNTFFNEGMSVTLLVSGRARI